MFMRIWRAIIGGLVVFTLTLSAWAQECEAWVDVCFGVDWKTATVSDIVQLDVNARDEISGDTPLDWAVSRNKDPMVIKALLKAGADVNARSDYDNTPLYGAAIFNNRAVIEVLLKAGADFHAQNKGGSTPLYGAAWANEDPAVIEVLLKAGADIHVQNKDGDTPLHGAAKSNENPAVLEALLEAGADGVNAQNKDGSTPLHKAVGKKGTGNINPTVVELLLGAGANPNIKDNSGKTPIDYIGANHRHINTSAYQALINNKAV